MFVSELCSPLSCVLLSTVFFSVYAVLKPAEAESILFFQFKFISQKSEVDEFLDPFLQVAFPPPVGRVHHSHPPGLRRMFLDRSYLHGSCLHAADGLLGLG